MPSDPSERIVSLLQRDRDAASDGAVHAFLDDLCSAIRVATGKTEGVTFATYVSDIIGDIVKAEVPFPNNGSGYDGPTFSFVVRPLDSEGHATHQLYGVPMIIGSTVPLEESGLLSRPITSMRFGQGFNYETDKLTQLVMEFNDVRGFVPRRVGQDLLVSITYDDLLRAYEKEEAGFNREGIQVTQVTILVPSGEGYKTEGAGSIAQRALLHPSHDMCFAYGVGERVYRGRPIAKPLKRETHGPRLLDHNGQGEECFFNIASLARVAVDGTSDDVQALHFTAIAVPLIGTDDSLKFQLERGWNDSSLLGGGLMKGGGMTFGGGTLGVDVAAFSTGRTTGTSSRLVHQAYDPSRKVGIIDAKVYTCSPDTMRERITQYTQ
ncbi:hypothetical protein HYS47_02710 [Candidatus Woesearchaeota archaeon]|nr:hypothetical protein [Candidatus Woesearchaeota archaeon]